MGTPHILQAGIVDVVFGAQVTVVQPANLYGCHIDDHCFIAVFRWMRLLHFFPGSAPVSVALRLGSVPACCGRDARAPRAHTSENRYIGPFVEIQKGVTIGKRCRIQSHAFICELVTIGDDCFISHGAMFINDVMKSGQPSYASQAWKSTQVGNNVVIGTNAVILPCRICDYALIGAGSVVTKNIDMPGIYAGNPARLIRPLDGQSQSDGRAQREE